MTMKNRMNAFERSEAYRRGRADVVVELVLHRATRMTVDELAKLIVVTPQEIRDALARMNAKQKRALHMEWRPDGSRGGRPNGAPRPAPYGQRWCSRHRDFHPITEFHFAKRKNGGYYLSWCRRAYSEYRAERRVSKGDAMEAMSA